VIGNHAPVTGIEAIAFDLDMTLVDSRPVSKRALERLVCEYGAQLDIDTLMSAYGVPLPSWLPANVDGALFRTLQAQDMALAVALPGAGAALAAVRQAGARVVVVTSAPHAIAIGMLEAADLDVDRVYPDAWGAQKAEPIRAENCWAFVGDHPDDMDAGRKAGVIAIGVNSGTSRPIGAQIELEDLTAFPSWLTKRSALQEASE
jgi:phosphoglycolate phosphatase